MILDVVVLLLLLLENYGLLTLMAYNSTIVSPETKVTMEH